MILTVTLNPAVDVTYHVDSLVPGATHRVSQVDERLGGKGVNVFDVLTQLGEPAIATGLLHPSVGPATFSPIAAAPRRTVAVTDGRDATGFWEPGPMVTAQEWAAFQAHFVTLLRGVSVVVLSGSLPGGLPDHAYASLISLARTGGCRTILDTSGPALNHGYLADPTIIKPNTAELAALNAIPSGVTTIVESHGPEGLRANGWQARPPRLIQGNPTGAGDACVAALARGLRDNTPWPQLLRDAVALSAAAVATPVAGRVDLELYQELLPQIVVKES